MKEYLFKELIDLKKNPLLFVLENNLVEKGTWLEFGVCHGRSMMWMVKLMRKYYPDSKYIGFDSWKGLPEESEGVWRPERHAEGRFSVSKD